ncbi:MAG: glycosyltransferase family 39 protein [Chloroflexota bacterium]|nr:glycosyltransferase family 39 protein [Chloroflexota bacterium]
MHEPAKTHSLSWSVSETWTAVALFLGTLLSRIPFRSQILYHWDSVNFAYAMREFSVAKEQPHPPGYIGYVWLCRLVDLLFHDPQTTIVWISVVSSGLAVVVMYLLGRAMFDRRTGLVGALFLATSPLFWFYGEIALPHTLDTFLVILSAWLLWEVMQGRAWAVVPTAVSMAVAGGVRQQTPIFLGLAALCAAVGFLRRVGWARGVRWGVLAVAIFGLLCASWFFPLINSAGGLDGYLQVMGDFSARFNATTSLFMGAGSFGLARNLRKLSMYTAFGWSVALVPLVFYALRQVWRRRVRVKWERVLFLLAWVLISLFFYVIIHMGQQGLVFVFLPTLLLVSALATVRLLEVRGRAALMVGVAFLVTINAMLFIALPEYPMGSEQFKVLSWDTLRHNDAYYQERFDAIRENFPAESTAILAASWHHVEYYLPDYALIPVNVISKWERDAGKIQSPQDKTKQVYAQDLGLSPDANNGFQIIIFDNSLEILNETPQLTRAVRLDDDGHMGVLTLSENQVLYYGHTFGIREP